MKAATAACGLSPSAFMRGLMLSHTEQELRCLLGNLSFMPAAERPEFSRLIDEIRGQVAQPKPAQPKADPELVRQVAIQGNLLNQVARSCNEARLTGGQIDSARIASAIEDVRKGLYRLAGIDG